MSVLRRVNPHGEISKKKKYLTSISFVRLSIECCTRSNLPGVPRIISYSFCIPFFDRVQVGAGKMTFGSRIM